MRSLKFLIPMVVVPWTAGQLEFSAPSCALRCWENTKYVSKCLDDYACLCSESEYQNSVFQCLYSQCDTAHFGSALHHTISQCSGISGQIVFTVPRNPDHDSLRRREAAYLAGAKLYGSGSDAEFPTQSAYPTQSIGPYLPSSMLTTPSYFPLQTPTAPASTSAHATEPAALTAATYIAPQLYTGVASTLGPYMVVSVLATIGSMYLVF